jgi:hypothetical protein
MKAIRRPVTPRSRGNAKQPPLPRQPERNPAEPTRTARTSDRLTIYWRSPDPTSETWLRFLSDRAALAERECEEREAEP